MYSLSPLRRMALQICTPPGKMPGEGQERQQTSQQEGQLGFIPSFSAVFNKLTEVLLPPAYGGCQQLL